MAEVTNEMIHELALQIDRGLTEAREEAAGLMRELRAIDSDMAAMARDRRNIRGILGRHDDRLDRIEWRLELREFAEPQRPFEPHP